MKHLTLSIIISFFTLSQSFAFISYTEPECFREIANIAQNELDSSLLISSKYNDILAKQWDIILDVSDENNLYKYIPFSSNIEQTTVAGQYRNTYSFWDIDSDIQREIILSLNSQIEKESFYFNFSFDSQYFLPKYFISKNGSSYSQVLRQDIIDYSLQKIKIVFEPIGKENIREIIKIRNIALMRRDSISGIQGIDTSRELTLYGWNSCGQTTDSVIIWEAYNPNASFTQVSFRKNSVYIEDNSDSDRDGVSDLKDNCKNIANPDQSDINQNGIGDSCEFDSDNDSIPDEIDNCRNTPNINQSDIDNDGIGDVCDNCLYYNPSQSDTDENGIGDTCDSRRQYLMDNDDDNDGIENSKDNCKFTANADQADDDNDGIGNACDNCKLLQNPFQEDTNENGVGDICEDSDNDGVEGLQDNCIFVANADQADDDNDGIGNACEDDDGDTIIFSNDNCPYIYNPGQEDFDKDGLGNACDENDDRLLETNKWVFIAIMILIILIFIWGIFMMNQKLKK